MGKVGPREKAMKKAEQKAAEKRKAEEERLQADAAKRRLEFAATRRAGAGGQPPAFHQTTSLNERKSLPAPPPSKQAKKSKTSGSKGTHPTRARTCKKVMTMCLIWHQTTCPFLTRMRGMRTPTIKNRISQNQRVNRMASTRTMKISVGIMKQSFPVSITMLPVYLRHSPTETPSLEATPSLS
jgi:hypothetical protein